MFVNPLWIICRLSLCRLMDKTTTGKTNPFISSLLYSQQEIFLCDYAHANNKIIRIDIRYAMSLFVFFIIIGKIAIPRINDFKPEVMCL